MSQHKGLSPDQVASINEAVAKCEKVLQSSSKKEEIADALKEVKDVSGKIFSAAYSASAGAGGASE